MAKLQILKPANVTSAGLIILAASFVVQTPPWLVKLGAMLVIVGSVWFFAK